jgi:hypothetical protein
MGAALVAGACGQAWAGYGLELIARGDTVQRVSPGGTAEFHFTLTNTGNQTDVYRFDCRVVDSVPGWGVVVCVRGLCVEPGTPIYDTLPAGSSDTTAKVTVYTNSRQGEEVVSLRVRSMGDTSLAESIATHTIVGAGVEELPRPDASEPGLRVGPTLVHRQTGASAILSTPEMTDFRVTLHDAVGRHVQTVARGVLSAGRHRIHWRPKGGLPDGVYLLRLTAGVESVVCKVVVE